MEEVTEGGVTVAVDEVRDGASEGHGAGVFYNPTQEFNRDLTVAVLRAHRERRGRGDGHPGDRTPTYLDAMTASGIRGVRAAAAGYDVTCTDTDPDAVALARANFARNDLAGTVHRRDVRACCYDEPGFDVVDLDPYGSPIPFADAALSTARELVAVTATDTAPLCGAHFAAGVRRYSTVPRNTEYHPEMGLRVLLSALVRTAARYDVAARPVCSHVTRHYARTYLAVDRGAGRADDLVDDLGYVHHCEDCLHREAERDLIAHPPVATAWDAGGDAGSDPVPDREPGPDPDAAPDDVACPACGSKRVLTAGPLYLGPVRDREFVADVAAAVTDDLATADDVRDVADRLNAELDTPTHYDQHRLCKLWGRPASGIDDFVGALRDAGHEASRAHYHGTAIKSTATVAEMRAATADL
jgi:tRNA (guanine26-N2/guanine27-N2)-dimethyltransferase